MSERILPTLDDLNRPFWDACGNGELVLQRCTGCERLRYPIAPVCPHCVGRDWTWERMSGRGAVYTFAVFRHTYNEAWRDRVPYTVAIVELEEGPMLIGDVAGVAPEDVHVGLPVQVDFEQVTDELAVPRFVPAEGTP